MKTLGLCFCLLLAMPLLAQPEFNDNVITRTIWWLTKVAFYGVGGALTIWGILLPVAKKVFSQGRHHEQSAVATIFWGLLVLAAPSILQLAIDWFNSDPTAAGRLDDLRIDMSGSSSQP